jgi:hypothetical protein
MTCLIVDESNLLCNTLFDEFEFEFKILAGKNGIIVLFHIGGQAICLSGGDVGQSFRQCRYSSLDLVNLLLLGLSVQPGQPDFRKDRWTLPRETHLSQRSQTQYREDVAGNYSPVLQTASAASPLS